TVFDSSVQRNEPITFQLNQVIPCWKEGVQLMKVGGKAKLVCPSAIAYGDSGRPPTIKPGATLLFDVELLEIVKEPPGDLAGARAPGGRGGARSRAPHGDRASDHRRVVRGRSHRLRRRGAAQISPGAPGPPRARCRPPRQTSLAGAGRAAVALLSLRYDRR